MEKFKVAIIGCGAIGKTHAEAYAVDDRVELACVADPIPGRAAQFAAKHGASKHTTDPQEALRDPLILAVDICLPNSLHAPMSMAALQAGKHVLCEKPIALTLTEAQAMQAEAVKQNKALVIGVVNRYNNAVNQVKEMIASGELGKLYHISFAFKAFRGIPGLGGWFTDKDLSGGGVMIDWGIHFIDVALYAAGLPTPKRVNGVAHSELGKDMKAYAYMGMWAGPPNFDGVYNVEEFVSGMVRTSGPMISFEGAWAQNIDKPAMYFDFLGTKAGLRLDYRKGFTLYGSENGQLFEKTPRFREENDFQKELRAFVDTARDGKPNRAHIDHVLGSQKVIDGFYRSAALGCEVEV